MIPSTEASKIYLKEV
jgi:hypothetical protein